MKTLNQKHELFVREMLKHGDNIKAYKTVYPGVSDASAQAASSRLLNNTAIYDRLYDSNRRVLLGLEKDRVAFIRQEVETIQLKRDILHSIYTKEARTTRTVADKFLGSKDIYIEPGNNEIIRSIMADSKLAAEPDGVAGLYYANCEARCNTGIRAALRTPR